MNYTFYGLVTLRMSESNSIGNPYILLTPGPLSTSSSVKEVMLRDWCTWDDDYNLNVVQPIQRRLVELATASDGYSSVLMQGSGTFCVESVIGSALPEDGKLLIIANGAYGRRLAQIAEILKINREVLEFGESELPDLSQIREALDRDQDITHVAIVHGETTTGMLNPIHEIGEIVNQAGRIYIVDAMSTFGGIPIDVQETGIDFLISSANKCIQGVPGFGFVVARKSRLKECEGRARSLSLDLYSQWNQMEEGGAKWRFTSPTHTVRAFAQALKELEEEGGIAKRFERYRENHRLLISGMEELGFQCLLPASCQSPIITAFHNPDSSRYEFREFYRRLKEKGFVIYPGKVTNVDTFRIGTIGHVFPDDFRRLIKAVGESIYWKSE